VTELLRNRLCAPPKRSRPLLFFPRDADRRHTVAEMAAKLSLHRGRGVRGERDTPSRVEPARRGDEPDGPSLDEIVERLTAAGVPPGSCADEREVTLDETVDRIGPHVHGTILLRGTENRKQFFRYLHRRFV
jgi:hypothetical protein